MEPSQADILCSVPECTTSFFPKIPAIGMFPGGADTEGDAASNCRFFRMICAALHSFEPDHLQALISFATKIQEYY